jgi:GT2 family glycosyltransferase
MKCYPELGWKMNSIAKIESQARKGYSDHRNGEIRARDAWRVVNQPLHLPYYLGVAYSILAYWAFKSVLQIGLIGIYLRLILPSTRKARLVTNTTVIILTSNVLSRRFQFCLRSVARSEIPEETIILQRSKDFSYSSGVNRGIETSKTDYVVLLNDDCFVKHDWLSSLKRLAESDSRIGIVGSKVLYTTGRVWKTEGRIPMTGKPIEVLFEPELSHPVKGYVDGSCMLIKKTAIRDIGLFDEVFSPFLYEDTDFCYRARLKGWLIYYCHESEVYHIGSATILRKERDWRKPIVERNRTVFLERWSDLIKREVV